MKTRQHDYISSQQSPYFLPYKRRYRESQYSHMFLEDFSGWFSSEFTPVGKRDGVYSVIPENDILKRLLLFSDRSYFDYSFDELLSEIMHYLLTLNEQNQKLHKIALKRRRAADKGNKALKRTIKKK